MDIFWTPRGKEIEKWSKESQQGVIGSSGGYGAGYLNL